VGELVTLRPLIAEVKDRFPGVQWGITSTTIAGRDGARAQYPDALFRRLLPLDAWPATPRFLNRIRPGAMIIVETELWPRLLLSLARRRVPVCLASARLTGRSVARYRRIAGLFGDVVRYCHPQRRRPRAFPGPGS
jgi:3-deoxy-D-manno-octulosonic-acid transferase